MAAAEERKDAVKELLEKGKKQGMLSTKEIQDTLEAAEIDSESIDKIYEQFEKMGIEITGDDIENELREIQLEEENEDLDDLSVPEGVSLDDPVVCRRAMRRRRKSLQRQIFVL